MPIGDCIYIDAIFLKDPEPPILMGDRSDCEECCYCLPVFWSDESNDLKHDKSSWPWFYDKNNTDAVVIYLEKIEGEYVEKATLDNNDLGILYPYGFIDNRLDQKAIAYELDWNLVYDEFGNGKYRMKAVHNDLLGVEKIEYSPEFSLRKYVPELAEETIRTEFTLNGEIGWFGESKVDFLGVDFYMQFRISNAKFGYWTDSVEQENRRFESGATLPISHIIIDKYKLEIIQAPEFMHRITQVMMRQAKPNTITDYTYCAKEIFNTKRAIFTSGFETTYTRGTDRSTVVYDLEEYFKNKITYR